MNTYVNCLRGVMFTAELVLSMKQALGYHVLHLLENIAWQQILVANLTRTGIYLEYYM